LNPQLITCGEKELRLGGASSAGGRNAGKGYGEISLDCGTHYENSDEVNSGCEPTWRSHKQGGEQIEDISLNKVEEARRVRRRDLVSTQVKGGPDLQKTTGRYRRWFHAMKV